MSVLDRLRRVAKCPPSLLSEEFAIRTDTFFDRVEKLMGPEDQGKGVPAFDDTITYLPSLNYIQAHNSIALSP